MLTDRDVVVLLLAHASEVFQPVLVDVFVNVGEVIEFLELLHALLVRQVLSPVVDGVDEIVCGA